MRSPRTTLLAIAAVALAVAGCGGGEIDADEVPGSPPSLTVPSDSELSAPDTDTGTGTDEDATTDPDAAATEDPAATDESAAPVVPAEPETGGTVPEEPQAAVPEDTTTEPAPAAPEEAPTEQFDTFCEQNVGAC
jgi:hypothetical protein